MRNQEGEIVHVNFGYSGNETNNTNELERLLFGIDLVISKGMEPTIIEGDSQIII